jgi:glycosyltransferase involved in cell wall biosynthesis
MTKILFIINDLMLAGAQRQLLQILKNLDKTKYESYVLCFSKLDVEMQEIKTYSKEIFYLSRRFRWDLSLILKIRRLIKQNKIEIVHTHLFMGTFYGVVSAKIADVSVVNQYIHNVKEDKLYRLLLMKILFHFSDRIFASSVCGLNYFNLSGTKKATVINNMVTLSESETEITLKKNIIKSQSRFIVGMVANLSKWKDYPTYFKMAELVLKSYPDTNFLCVGDGEFKERYYKIVQDLKISSHIIFMGQISNIYDIINQIDVGILFSYEKHSEAQSFAIGEYMMMGKPVIASKVGGIVEIVEHEKTGYLVQPGDYKSAAAYLIELMKNTELRKKLGDAGKETIYEKFNSEKIIRKIENIYDELVN